VESEAQSNRPGADAPTVLPVVSVIIPVFNDFDGVRLCIQALHRQELPPAEFEILIVDNGPEAGAAERVAEIANLLSGLPHAQALHEPRSGSYAARNRGLDAASAPLLAFTDADCQPESGWLAAGIGYLRKHPEADAIAGSIQLFAQDAESPTGTELYEIRHGFQQEKYVATAGFGATANLIARRETFERVGPFDSALQSGGDKEWGSRLRANGLRLVYLAEASVRHPARRTHKEMRTKIKRVVDGDITLRKRQNWRLLNWMRYSLQPLRPPLRTIWRARRDPVIRTRSELARYGVAFILARWTTAVYRLRRLNEWA
jgi:glycosyltransferase involved in cell wall biosynthesis